MATLAGLPGVSVVSVSYGWFLDAFGQESLERTWDSTILQPAIAAHPNVSFFASSGDSGAGFGLIYPAASPEVVSVGGTSLNLTASGQWSSEVGWGGSGGGYSQAFAIPSYQQNDGFSGNNGMRTNPDVAADADPATGVAVYDPYDLGSATPWDQVGGTSLATPLWAGMVAIADQGRVLAGGQPLGATQALTGLYGLPSSDFHDITTGSNGSNGVYDAGTGYDLVTGIGTPIGNMLVHDLATPPTITATANKTTLWPPNGTLVPVTVSGTITSPYSTVTASFRVVDEYGMVQPSGPITVDSDGTFSFIVYLQASRKGQDKDGRLYQIFIDAVDPSGNKSELEIDVTVPHDQGQ